MKNIVILISGRGSNMQAIVHAAQTNNWQGKYQAQIAAVISNRPHAAGLDFARVQGLAVAALDHKAYASREDFDLALMDLVDAYHPDLVVLAGFMRVLTPVFVRHYEGRLINIHPSLLPAFPGLDTHQRALDAGCRFAGVTVHQVNEEVDGGKILDQAIVPILPGDTADTLAARVLEQEHVIYPRVIAAWLAGQT